MATVIMGLEDGLENVVKILAKKIARRQKPALLALHGSSAESTFTFQLVLFDAMQGAYGYRGKKILDIIPIDEPCDREFDFLIIRTDSEIPDITALERLYRNNAYLVYVTPQNPAELKGQPDLAPNYHLIVAGVPMVITDDVRPAVWNVIKRGGNYFTLTPNLKSG